MSHINYILTYRLNAWLYLFAQEPVYSDLYHTRRSLNRHKMDEHHLVWEILVLSAIICHESSVE